MNSHEETFRELYGIQIPKEKKLDFSKKETWDRLKESLMQKDKEIK